MTEDQRALFEALAAHLEREPGVEALWLAGSLGAGGGDAFSDVDLLLLAADSGGEALSAALARDLGQAFNTVLVEPLYGGRVLHMITADWERFDLSIVERDGLARYDANTLTPVFNRSDAAPPAKPEIPYQTPPERLLRITTEFIRVMGLLPVALGREEFQNALSGIDILRRMTLELMLEENSVAPEKRGGMLHPSRFLTDEQRAALASLPPLAAERDSLIAANAAFARLFLPRAKALAADIGVTWPQAFEGATRRHLKKTVGLEI